MNDNILSIPISRNQFYSIPDDRARARTCSPGAARTPPTLPPSPAPATPAVSLQIRPFLPALFYLFNCLKHKIKALNHCEKKITNYADLE